jgi:streptomycin 6-kinase
MVKLLRFDPGRRAMLLEKLTPGEDLRTIFEGNETNVIPIAVDLMRRIWRDALEKSSFPILEDWFNNGFGKALKTNFPAEHVNKAWNIFNAVNSQTGRRLLLHGDLHHWNILSAVREPYLVIDPKGIIGNFGYELSTFLINHANWLRDKEDRKEKLDAAIHEFSLAFDVNPQTVRKWTYAQSVLSAWWTFEEGSEKWRDELARTEIWDV